MHTHIISESRSGSTWLYSKLAKQYKQDVWLSECFDIDKINEYKFPPVIETIELIKHSESPLVFKNHYHQLTEWENNTLDKILNLPAQKIVMMRKDKLDQCLSLALARQTRNWNRVEDTVIIDIDIWDIAVQNIHDRYVQLLEFSKTCDQVLWYEDLDFSGYEGKGKNLPKNKTIKNYDELVSRYNSNK